MFVGEVRWATTGVGIVLEVVGRQAVVLRTDERLEEQPGAARGEAKRLDVGVRELLGRRFGGRQADPPGDERRQHPQPDRTAPRSSPRPASRRERGPPWPPRTPPHPPSGGRSRQDRGRGWPWPVRRSPIRGGCLRVTYSRVNVRTIASTISHAWWASNVKASPAWIAASTTSLAEGSHMAARGDARPFRAAVRRRSASTRGMSTQATTNAVHSPADADGIVHAATSVASVSGGDSVRRRLSTIFQRAMPWIELRLRRPVAVVARPRIQGRSCQSPRAQRCWRAAETR